MKHKIMGIVALCAFFLITHDTFGAKFTLTNASPFVAAVIVKTMGIAWTTDRPLARTLAPGETWTYDAGLGGFEWAEVTMCDKVIQYSMNVVGGARDWKLSFEGAQEKPENLTLYIGPAGLDPALGTLRGKVIKKSRKPCACPAPTTFTITPQQVDY